MSEREMSLTEYAWQLHPEHRVNKELKALLEAHERLRAELEALKVENERLRAEREHWIKTLAKSAEDATRWRKHGTRIIDAYNNMQNESDNAELHAAIDAMKEG